MATLALLTPHGWFLRGLGDMHGPGGRLADGRAGGRRAARHGPRDRARIGVAPGAPPGDAPMIEPPARSSRSRASTSSASSATGRPVLRVRPADDHHRRARAPVRRPGRGAARGRRARRATPSRPQRWSRCSRGRDAVRRPPDRRRGDAASTRWSTAQLEAGVVIPDGFAGGARAASGTAEVRYLGTTEALTPGLRAPVEAAVARVGRDRDGRAGRRRPRALARLGRRPGPRPRPATRACRASTCR